MNEDLQLSLAERLKLIKGIEFWQKKRWERLKFYHNCPLLTMPVRHFFMKREIALIRAQKQRLMVLKQNTIQ